MISEETERICFNCNYFFPASDEITEYGICLEDNAFNPYLEELLEKYNFASCRDLIEQKKFPGENEACEKFEEIERLEIDDDSPLGELLNHINETGETDLEKIKEALFEIKLRHELKTMPVEIHLKNFECGKKEVQKEAIRNLGALVFHGNSNAFEALFNILKALPPPNKIEDVHMKIDILKSLEHGKFPDRRSKIISLLIEELYVVSSNNTTRQWITKMLEYLANAPEAEVCQPLETLLKKRKFPVRTQEKIKAVLEHVSPYR